MSFKNKVVIVTGGSAGIGAATVEQFAREGAKVVIVGRNEENLKKVAEKCQSLNADYLIVKADVTNDNDLKRIVEETIKKYGQIDILINNAGILKKSSIVDDEAVKLYDSVMNTNFKSIVVLSSLATPYLIKTKGNIVNISSVAGSKAALFFSLYCASKAALNMFSNVMALELAQYGVRVNTVSPGPVRTDVIQNGGRDGNMEDYASATILGRISDPVEVADMILFVASDKAKGVSGSNFVTDNGYLLK